VGARPLPPKGDTRVAADIVKSLQALRAARQALVKRERDLIAGLNAVLPNVGYRVVPVTAGPPSRSPVRRTAPAASPKSLSCPHCSRTFARSLHLGRHVSATHKVKLNTTRVAGDQATAASAASGSEPRRRRMSPAARRAAAQRMKAYWKKRKAAERSTPRSSPPGVSRRQTARRRSRGRP
jgi:hypothetical protein